MITPIAKRSPYYGPVNESATEILFEKMFISGSFLTVFGYTLQLVLYFRCMKRLWKSRYAPISRFLIWFITILVLLSGVYTGCTAWCISHTFVDNRNYPGGPAAFMKVEFSSKFPVNAAVGYIGYLVSAMTDGLLVWRCWKVYAASNTEKAYIAIILPSLLYLASVGTGIYCTVLDASPAFNFKPSILHMNIIYVVLTMSLNVVITVMIIARMTMYQRSVGDIRADSDSPYTHIWKLFAESAALYSIMSIILVICFALSSPLQELFWGLWPSSQAISNYLIIYLQENRETCDHRSGTQLSTQIMIFSPQTLNSETKEASTASTKDKDDDISIYSTSATSV